MSELRAIARLRIHNDKLEEFKEDPRNAEPGTDEGTRGVDMRVYSPYQSM